MDRLPNPVFLDSPCSSDGKEFCLQCGKHGLDPWIGKIPLVKGMTTHSCIPAWRILSQRVEHYWVTFAFMNKISYFKIYAQIHTVQKYMKRIGKNDANIPKLIMLSFGCMYPSSLFSTKRCCFFKIRCLSVLLKSSHKVSLSIYQQEGQIQH